VTAEPGLRTVPLPARAGVADGRLGDGWAPAPYAGSDEHLWDELRRVDQLVRAQVVRWRATVAATKPAQLWGMLQVSDLEVEGYLGSRFTGPEQLPEDLARGVARFWAAAEEEAGLVAERRARTPAATELRLDLLARRFGLSDLDRDVLLVHLLAELDGRYRRLFGYLQDDASKARPTVELVLEILRPRLAGLGQGRAAFHPRGALLANRLLCPDDGAHGADPLPSRRFRVDDRVADYLLGDDNLDGRLAGMLHRSGPGLGVEDLVGEPRQLAWLRAVTTWLGGRTPPGQGAVVLLHGPYGSGRGPAAAAICRTLGLPLLVAGSPAVLAGGIDWRLGVELSFREAVLGGAALCWTGCEALLDPGQAADRWDHLMARAEAHPWPTFLVSGTAWDPVGRFRRTPFVRIDLGIPGHRARRRLWERHLPADGKLAAPPPDRATLAALLADGFQLTEGQILDALATARGHAVRRQPAESALTVADLYEGCRRQSNRRLVTFAMRVEPRTELTFDDLVLPPAGHRQLGELRQRIRHRTSVHAELGFERRLPLGNGLVAMFTGTSGTGKTMAAELLAREQGVDLYKVDLSAVISKWVGETEKNLGRLFLDAEEANAIVFFDEADALFGRRGEVKEARDRWANIEINYLLQRVEEYSGVVILASNLRQNIDEAFMRRIHVVVDFPFPDAGARLRILQGMFPGQVQRPADEELATLAARFALSGGSIRNVVVDAAFRSLAEYPQGPARITMRHLAGAIAREYQKLGRPITRGEFGEDLYAWLETDVL
jgi:hypothetical protein